MTASTTRALPSEGDSIRPRRALRVACGLVALAVGCGGTDWPYQEIPVAGDTVALAPFVGNWYYGSGELGLVVRLRPAPRLGARLPASYRLERAWIEDGQLYFDLTGKDSVHTTWARRYSDGVIVLLVPGGRPSGCGTCTPWLERHATAWLASRWVRGLRELPESLRDRATERLAEAL